jgi:hypothetical protein
MPKHPAMRMRKVDTSPKAAIDQIGDCWKKNKNKNQRHRQSQRKRPLSTPVEKKKNVIDAGRIAKVKK